MFSVLTRSFSVVPQTRSEYRRFFSSCSWLPACLRPTKSKESSYYSSNTHSNTQTTHAAGSPTTVGTPFAYPRVTLLPVPPHYSSLKRHEASLPRVVPHHLHQPQYQHQYQHQYQYPAAPAPRGAAETGQYAEPYATIGGDSPPTSGRHPYDLSRSSSLLLKGRASSGPPPLSPPLLAA